MLAETIVATDLDEVLEFRSNTWTLATTTRRKRESRLNEDSIGFLFANSGNDVIACISDGAGGHANGEVASRLVVETLVKTLRPVQCEGSYRAPILDALEKANQQVIGTGTGAAATAIVVEITGDYVRSYHVGDSAMLLIGGKGKCKYQTVGHSSYDLAEEAGVAQALNADEESEMRSTLTNCVGDREMRIEVSSEIPLAQMDKIILGSDGLFDNVSLDTISQVASINASESVNELSARATTNMYSPNPNAELSKPDDLSVLAITRRRSL